MRLESIYELEKCGCGRPGCDFVNLYECDRAVSYRREDIENVLKKIENGKLEKFLKKLLKSNTQ